MVFYNAHRISLLFFILSSHKPVRSLVPRELAGSVIKGLGWLKSMGRQVSGSCLGSWKPPRAGVGRELAFVETTWGCWSQQMLGWVKGLDLWEPLGPWYHRSIGNVGATCGPGAAGTHWGPSDVEVALGQESCLRLLEPVDTGVNQGPGLREPTGPT